MAAIQGLEYIISLTDQLSSPLKGVMKTIDDLGKRGEDAMRRIGLGAAGVIAAGASLKNALDPAIDFSRALNEVKATGREQAGLDKITDFALDFSATYGGAATDVVNSTNEIARAIDGLTDSELIAFSKSSNILAKATGSDVKAMGSYVSQLYGIFGDEAAKIGKEKWVEQISAQATVTANKFKSSGESLMQAYTNLGSSAKDHGIKTAEQFAIIGNLQNVFEGGLAGTKYAAFLNGAVKAQKKLGLSFLDSRGKMLPMINILEKIKGKYGELNSENLYELQKAFGTKEAAQVINNLLPKIDSLKADIAEIDKMKTLDDAMAISKTVTDSWMRFQAIFQNIKIAIGTQILARIEPLMNRIADMGQEFTNWLRTYKNIARWIGYAVGALIGFTGLTAALTLMSGVISAIGIAFAFLASPVMLVAAAVIGLGIVIYKFRAQFMDFITGFVAGFKIAGVSFAPLFSAFSIVWGALQRIGATIGRIIGLFGSASDSAYSFQQFGIDVGYAVGVVFNTLLSAVELVAQAFSFTADLFAIVTNVIIEGWMAVTTLWDSNKPIESFLNIATALGNIFSRAFKSIVNAFTDVINAIIKMANNLPGINIPLIPKWDDSTLPEKGSATAVGASIGAQALQMQNQIGALNTTSPKFELSERTKPQFTKMPSGSVSKAITQNQHTTKTINYGGVTINSNDGKKVWQEMRNREQLAAG
ncbi:phage tail tape measure protein [Rodentibacter pneumotropicus]|uniref:phage tail tape measure protein n=1 Tax=Rodentibacter pneumotropicus TaxID=758 RepID=UPI00035C74AC|nr:phage tail tape measure protein [Rodentibacter pneumotropicus]THA15648.1 phage tail tape measure protein [Rodentibacter pneumotropicus]